MYFYKLNCEEVFPANHSKHVRGFLEATFQLTYTPDIPMLVGLRVGKVLSLENLVVMEG